MSIMAFSKWGIDFLGPIKTLTKGTHLEYIIVATIDYLTKWVKARATSKNNARSIEKFECVFMPDGLPIEIVSDDQGKHFLNEVIEHLLHDHTS